MRRSEKKRNIFDGIVGAHLALVVILADRKLRKRHLGGRVSRHYPLGLASELNELQQWIVLEVRELFL